MIRLSVRTRPTIAMPGFTIPPGITVRPELVLRTLRRDRRDRPRLGVETRLAELLARADLPVRNVDPRIAERLAELLARADLPVRNVDPRISRLPAFRPVGRPAPVNPVRPARDPRIPVIVALLAGASAVVLVVAVIVRRRAAAAPAREAGEAAAGVVAAPPPAPSAPAWLRRFVTHRFNPAVVRLGLVGGRRSPWAYLEHVGRTTGVVYRTPVLPRIAGEYACVPLPYGMDVNWARNVRAAGHCRLQVRGTVYELDEPAVITAAEHPDLPEAFRGWLIRRGNRYLRLHLLSAAPGSLDTAAQPAEPAPPVDTTPIPEPSAAAPAADAPTVEPG
jgi:hypothetical protein